MNFPKDVKCVIFDMDGVIIDSEEIHKKAYYETFVSIGVDVSDDLYKTLTGSSTINAFQKLINHFNLTLIPQDLVLAKRKRYVNFFENDPTLHLVKGIEELIKHCYNKGLTLILASSSAMVNQRLSGILAINFLALISFNTPKGATKCSRISKAVTTFADEF